MFTNINTVLVKQITKSKKCPFGSLKWSIIQMLLFHWFSQKAKKSVFKDLIYKNKAFRLVMSLKPLALREKTKLTYKWTLTILSELSTQQVAWNASLKGAGQLFLTSWLLAIWSAAYWFVMRALSGNWVASVHIALSIIGLPHPVVTIGTWYVHTLIKIQWHK